MNTNLISVLKSASSKAPDKIAIFDGDIAVSYGVLWTQVNQLSSELERLGIEEGQRVVLVLHNGFHFIVSFLAVLQNNLIAVPLRESVTKYELAKIIKDCTPAVLITDSPYALSQAEAYDQMGVTVVILWEKNTKSSDEKTPLSPRIHLIGHKEKQQNSLHKPAGLATISYTYRGLGLPLGAMLTHENFLSGLKTYTLTTEMNSEDRALLILPAAHVYSIIGCILSPLSLAATVVILRWPIPKDIFSSIQERKITILTAVPTLYRFLAGNMENYDFGLSTVRRALSGGSFLDSEIFEEVKNKMFLELLQGYGLTECLPVTCNTAGGNRPGTLGKAGVGVAIKILNDGGKEAKASEIGEILIGGPTVMRGYYGKEEETAQVLRNGWFHSGDCGFLDEDGYLHFSGVKKLISKIGGNMVDLKEVEMELLSHEKVDRVSVLTKCDELWGNILCAKVWLKPGKVGYEREIRDYLKERLSPYKIPSISLER